MELDRCQDIESGLSRYALGFADDRMSMRVQLHLAEGCVGCARELEDLMVRFHMAALAGGPAELPEGFEDEVLVAASSCEQERVEAVIVYPETSERRLLWILLGLSLLMVAAVAWWGADQQAERRSSQDKAAVMEQVASRSIEELGSLRTIANRVTDPRLPVADLHGSGDDFAQVRARAVYDLARAELWLRVVALPAATNNEVYALWLGEPGQEQLVGSLLPQIFMRGGTSHFALPEEVREPFRLRLSRQSSEGLAEAPGLGVIVFAAVLGAQPPAEPAD